MSSRTKIGISLDPRTNQDLDALSFASGQTKSAIVDEAVRKFTDSLSRDARQAFELARNARAKG
jgi:predicted DNA-binding protein